MMSKEIAYYSVIYITPNLIRKECLIIGVHLIADTVNTILTISDMNRIKNTFPNCPIEWNIKVLQSIVNNSIRYDNGIPQIKKIQSSSTITMDRYIKAKYSNLDDLIERITNYYLK